MQPCWVIEHVPFGFVFSRVDMCHSLRDGGVQPNAAFHSWPSHMPLVTDAHKLDRQGRATAAALLHIGLARGSPDPDLVFGAPHWSACTD